MAMTPRQVATPTIAPYQKSTITIIPHQNSTPTMFPYKNTTIIPSHFKYNEANVTYNSHITYEYFIDGVGGVIFVREVATPTMKGRTNGSL